MYIHVRTSVRGRDLAAAHLRAEDPDVRAQGVRLHCVICHCFNMLFDLNMIIMCHVLRTIIMCHCLNMIIMCHVSCDFEQLFTLLDVCVSSLRRGHANILCIVPMLTDDPRRESREYDYIMSRYIIL